MSLKESVMTEIISDDLKISYFYPIKFRNNEKISCIMCHDVFCGGLRAESNE